MKSPSASDPSLIPARVSDTTVLLHHRPPGVPANSGWKYVCRARLGGAVKFRRITASRSDRDLCSLMSSLPPTPGFLARIKTGADRDPMNGSGNMSSIRCRGSPRLQKRLNSSTCGRSSGNTYGACSGRWTHGFCMSRRSRSTRLSRRQRLANVASQTTVLDPGSVARLGRSHRSRRVARQERGVVVARRRFRRS